MLCYDSTYFLQWLEGPRDAINTLYRTLMLDERHVDLLILDYGMIGARSFAHWDMACICTDDIQPDTILKYVYEQSFDPYKMSGEGAKAFLLEVAGEMPGEDDEVCEKCGIVRKSKLDLLNL